jgi:hypothetical protein
VIIDERRINASEVKQKDRAGPHVEQFDYMTCGPLLALIIDGQLVARSWHDMTCH